MHAAMGSKEVKSRHFVCYARAQIVQIVVILDLLRNSSLKYVQDDDSLATACRLGDGWHMLGSVVTMSENGTKNMMTHVSPVMDCSGDRNTTVIVPPVPRYVYGGCCRDKSHAQNTSTMGHAESMLASQAKVGNAIKKRGY